MAGYPMVKKIRISLFVLTQLTNVTDGQTPHDGIGRALCIASRGKQMKEIFFIKNRPEGEAGKKYLGLMLKQTVKDYHGIDKIRFHESF